MPDRTSRTPFRISLLAVLFSLCLLAGCGGGGGGGGGGGAVTAADANSQWDSMAWEEGTWQ